MATVNRANFAETTLGAAIADADDTAITVTSGTSFPAAPFLVTIGTEILKCTSKGTGEDWTVTRGEQGSTAAAHDSGAAVQNTITADDLNLLTEGPASATDENIAVFDGASGKILKDGSVTVATLAPLASPTFTGTVTLPDVAFGENSILLPVMSGDEKWSGIVIGGTAGATLAVGDICFLQTADVKWELVDGILDGTDLGFKLQLGICVLAANADAATKMLVYGKIRSAAFPAFTIGAPVYLSDTAGDVVVAQPSTTNFAVRIVGYALTAEDLLFNPSNDWLVNV